MGWVYPCREAQLARSAETSGAPGHARLGVVTGRGPGAWRATTLGTPALKGASGPMSGDRNSPCGPAFLSPCIPRAEPAVPDQHGKSEPRCSRTRFRTRSSLATWRASAKAKPCSIPKMRFVFGHPERSLVPLQISSVRRSLKYGPTPPKVDNPAGEKPHLALPHTSADALILACPSRAGLRHSVKVEGEFRLAERMGDVEVHGHVHTPVPIDQ